jgi:aryl-alcohol dehydrogenase-like predicted oxidoreductase
MQLPRRGPLALELSYRHIDTARAYGNEESVVPRDQVFITTKFNPGRRDPVAEVERSLERLGVERVDPYIVHWPRARAPSCVADSGDTSTQLDCRLATARLRLCSLAPQAFVCVFDQQITDRKPTALGFCCESLR